MDGWNGWMEGMMNQRKINNRRAIDKFSIDVTPNSTITHPLLSGY